MDRRVRLLAALLCLVPVPASAAHILHRPLETEPDSLDPLKTTETVADAIERDLFEGLVRFDSQGHVVPGVAERWELAPDGVTYIFHLRPDARWSNGEALTAQDFVYAWRRGVD